MSPSLWIVASLALTVLAYQGARAVQARFVSPLATPVFVATIGIIAVLAACGIDYASYRHGSGPLLNLLGPATAALALPLYRHRQRIAACILPVMAGIASGVLATLVAAVLLAIALHLPHVIVASIGIKSVTAPIAVELAPLIGADPALTVGLVVTTGMLGAIFGPWLLNLSGVHDPISRGLAFGAISHGIGTARAAAEGELQGAVSGVAMGATALFVPAIAPWLVPLLMRVAQG